MSAQTTPDRPFELPEELRSQVLTGAELVRRRRRQLCEEPLPTGLAELDRLLRGGLPRGELVELVGRASCGRFAVALSTLAGVTGRGEPAALVDLGGHLDPQTAAAAGIDLERLLWLHPRRVDEAVAAAEAVLLAGFPLVLLDAGLPPLRGRASAAAWLRLQRAAAARSAAALAGTPYRLSGPAAAVVLDAGRARPRWAGRFRGARVLEGIETTLTLLKRRGERPGAEVDVILRVPEAPPAPAPRPTPAATEERRAHGL